MVCVQFVGAKLQFARFDLTRLSVHESVADQFVQAIQKEMLNVRAGSSVNPEKNRLRGVVTDTHAARVVALVKDALEKGAKIVVGDPNQVEKYGGGNVIQPFVLDHVGPEMGASVRC